MLIELVLAATFVLPKQQSDATIGFTAVNLQSGQRVSVRGAERFPMGSVYKFPIALAVLRRVDAGEISLEQKVTIAPEELAPGWSPLRDEARGKTFTTTVGDLLERMVSISDNSASDALLRLAGGPSAVTKRMTELNVTNVRIDRSELQIHRELDTPDGVERYALDVRDTSTPDAMADLLAKFYRKQEGLKPASHDLLLALLTKSPTGKAKLRAGAPAGWTVAHKSGMMPGTSNDVGLLVSPDGKTRIAIAIFAKAAKSDYDVVDADIAAITRAVVEELR